MSFETEYQAYMLQQSTNSKGERQRRLLEGHGHAEKKFLREVWWPAVGHFDYLHAEYEVFDFKDGTRYLDFAYLRGPFQVCFEIDGFGPHSRNLNRHQFSDQLVRQNHLILDNWKVIRFSYDDITEKPRRCQQTVQQLLGRWFGDEQSSIALTWKQKEIVRLAVNLGKPIAPADVYSRLGISDRYARTLLHQLVEANVLEPASGALRIRAYRLKPGIQTFHL